jgi:hypothetical protein
LDAVGTLAAAAPHGIELDGIACSTRSSVDAISVFAFA